MLIYEFLIKKYIVDRSWDEKFLRIQGYSSSSHSFGAFRLPEQTAGLLFDEIPDYSD